MVIIRDTVKPPLTTPSESDSRERPRAEKIVAAAELFEGRREILIRHAGSLYRLRITQTNKLILTK
jgi:hemin uptake protein HemP